MNAVKQITIKLNQQQKKQSIFQVIHKPLTSFLSILYLTFKTEFTAEHGRQFLPKGE